MKLIGIIVANEVLAAFLKSKPNTEVSMETNSVPPPTPIPALNNATKKPSSVNLGSICGSDQVFRRTSGCSSFDLTILNNEKCRE